VSPKAELNSIIKDLDMLCKKCNREIQSKNFSRVFIYVSEFNNLLTKVNQLIPDLVSDIEPIKRSNPDVYFSADDEERLSVVSKVDYAATKLLQKLRTI